MPDRRWLGVSWALGPILEPQLWRRLAVSWAPVRRRLSVIDKVRRRLKTDRRALGVNSLVTPWPALRAYGKLTKSIPIIPS